jgi:hypothetical protein
VNILIITALELQSERLKPRVVDKQHTGNGQNENMCETQRLMYVDMLRFMLSGIKYMLFTLRVK